MRVRVPSSSRIVFLAVLCFGAYFFVVKIMEKTLQRKPILFGVALDGYPILHNRISGPTKNLSFTPEIIQFYLQWPERPGHGVFPTESLDAIWNSGAVPCITWEPMYINTGKEFAISASKILSGEYDAYIDAFREGAAKWNKPLLIRFAHEMNLNRYHWGGEKIAYGASSPEIYKALYRYVVTRMRQNSNARIAWVFSPNAESVPSESWNTVAAYYPGEDVVDVLGMDGYSWYTAKPGETSAGDQSFRSVFSSLYQSLRPLSSKPLLVFETATMGDPAYKKDWLIDAFDTAHRWGIDGIVWFDANKERDWSLPTFTPRENPFIEPYRSKVQGRDQVVARLFPQ